MTVRRMSLTEFDDPQDIEQFKRKIRAARKWAQEYFRADKAATATLLDPPAFFVEFPHPTQLLVTPAIMGQKAEFGVPYVLTFRRDGAVVLNGVNPVTKDLFPPIVISAAEIEAICARYESPAHA